MNTKYIFIILGEPYSTFSEIIGKYFLEKSNIKTKIIILGSYLLLKKQLEKLNIKLNLNQIKNLKDAKKNTLNIINIDFKFNKVFSKITNKSNKYIENCFKSFFKLIKGNKEKFVLINGPVSKKNFLKKKYLGITEYLSKKTKAKNEIMLIYNSKLSVSPITTHLPLKYVSKHISQKKIITNVLGISKFYKSNLKKNPKFAILGLNPHCETVDKFSEEIKIINPAIKKLKIKGVNINGPFPADTFFLEKNLIKYDVVIGMYHDQVLTPIKTLFKFDAINITIGLPFIRISPDHGPNTNMQGKNKSRSDSLKAAMNFIKKFK